MNRIYTQSLIYMYYDDGGKFQIVCCEYGNMALLQETPYYYGLLNSPNDMKFVGFFLAESIRQDETGRTTACTAQMST